MRLSRPLSPPTTRPNWPAAARAAKTPAHHFGDALAKIAQPPKHEKAAKSSRSTKPAEPAKMPRQRKPRHERRRPPRGRRPGRLGNVRSGQVSRHRRRQIDQARIDHRLGSAGRHVDHARRRCARLPQVAVPSGRSARRQEWPGLHDQDHARRADRIQETVRAAIARSN